MAYVQGATYGQKAVAAFHESLERGCSEAFAWALRLFMPGERSRLLAVDPASEKVTCIVNLIRVAGMTGRHEWRFHQTRPTAGSRLTI